MSPAPFDSEDAFQELLERHPALLTSTTFGEATPRRWALIQREMSIGDGDGSSGRWSLDHLFIDQDGIPTLVEIKRAKDTRARREVVAQMLDYAANAVSWWRVGDLIESFAHTADARGLTSAQALAALLETAEVDEEAFWRTVQANLTSGRIRLLFVADVIHPELQRIVEFLNEQMSPAVVAALELRPFAAGSERLIVPRIIGDTPRANAAKALTNERVSLPASISEWLASGSEAEAASASRLLTVCRDVGLATTMARKSVRIKLGERIIAYIGPELQYFQMSFVFLKEMAEFRDPSDRKRLLQSLLETMRPWSQKQNLDGWPAFCLPAATDEKAWTTLKELLSQISDALSNGNDHV